MIKTMGTNHHVVQTRSYPYVLGSCFHSSISNDGRMAHDTVTKAISKTTEELLTYRRVRGWRGWWIPRLQCPTLGGLIDGFGEQGTHV